MPWLPGLRSKALPAVVPSPIPLRSPEAKVVLASYYNGLLAAGYESRTRNWSVDRAVQLGYERCVWIFKGVNAITGNWARLPIVVRDGHDPVPDHPVAQILNGLIRQAGPFDRRPRPSANPLETGPIFRKRAGAQVLLSKAGVFVEVTRSNMGTLKRVDLLPPGRTQIVPPRSGDELVDHLVVTNVRGQRRRVEWENALWIRDPHPLDPYSGVTPLEAAGLSVELDHMARVYNVNFLARDGRPGGIVAIEPNPGEDGDVDPEQMDRIEDKFGKGPAEAGALTVLLGKIQYIDPSARPRDMAYAQLAAAAKAECLGALGVPLSVIGDASGRTFSNASQELDNFWLVEPMPGFLRTMLDGLQQLVTDDGLKLGVDDSEVESMVRAKEKRLADARAEVAAGCRSIWSYYTLAGRTNEIEDNPHTRALWIPQGMNPLPSSEADAAVVNGTGSPPGAPGGPGAAGGLPPAALATAPTTPGALPDAPTAPGAAAGSPLAIGSAHRALAALPASTSATAAVANLAGKSTRPPGRPRAPRPRRPGLRVEPGDPAASPGGWYGAAAALRDTHEKAIGDALEAVVERMVERSVARLQSPKQRKDTRHYHGPDPDRQVKALDTTRVVDPDRWGQDAVDAARPATDAAGQAAASAAADDLAGPLGADRGSLVKDVAVGAVTAGALDMLRRSAQLQGERLAAALNLADQAGADLASIVGRVRAWGGRLRRWARALAAQITTAVLEGCGQAVALAAIRSGLIDPARVTQTWVTRHDERVRQTHRAADGQTVALTAPFVVGGALLRYPGDPLGPPAETANCRCGMVLRVRPASPASVVTRGTLAV